MAKANWQSDWSVFIKAVAAAFDRGMSDAEVSDMFGGNRVTWVGTVEEKELDFANPLVVFHMPPISVKLKDGRSATTSFLSAKIDPSELPNWRKVSDGATVEFEVSISEGVGPFTSLSWADLDDESYIRISVNNAVLLKKV